MLLLGAATLASAQPQPGAEAFSGGTPPIVETLGSDRVVELTAVNVPKGKVVWFNSALAAEMGIALPPGGVMTPELEAQLMRHLSWRIVPQGETVPEGARTTKVYADRYGGWGMGHNKGAGRAAFFGEYNLNIKGVGVTPLVSNNTHYSHRHGGAPLSEGVLEAVWGELGTNLFNRGSTRILAVIDVGDVTKWQDGGQERRALIVRAGHQVRPAHLLAEGFNPNNTYEATIRMLRQTGTLVETQSGGRPVLDLDASLNKLAELHARTAAELYRYRILHGGLSPGNKSLDGGMLDLGTITSQPRTAPVHVLDYKDYSTGSVREDLRFETENQWRVRDLEAMRKVLSQGRGKPGVRFGNPDVGRVYEAAYRQQMELQLLQASGLKPDAAKALRAADPALVKDYAQTLRRLGGLTNDVDMNIERNAVTRGSVVDVFGALSKLPGLSGSEAKVLEALAIDADKPATAEKARELGKRLAALHSRVMEGGFQHGGQHYDSREAYERSVRERAAFENRPIDQLYRSELLPKLRDMISRYEKSGEVTELRRTIESWISESTRDVENLMGREARVVGEGVVETGVELREGVRYSVRANEAGTRLLRVELPLEAVPGTGWRFLSVDAPNV
ncbi:MAG TPA: hypothetical protein DEA08_26465, partial [Planctomycetes bacterium]|nr:hypothetical protein [Planctomycetota bacterium]